MARKVCVLALFAITWSFYSWTARSDGKPFAFDHSTKDYYNMMTDGFLEGHLYLPVVPDPRLLQTADPYDPKQNAPYRMHDVSLYRGRFYLYFGAAPAVSLLLPFRLVTDLRFPESLAVAFFLFAGLVVSYWSFQFIIRRFAPQTPGYFSIIAVILFGLGNFAPFILRRPAFYELAIACAYFYYFSSVYFLLRGLFEDRRSLWKLAAAAVCLGMAVAARPNYVVIALGALCMACGALLWRGSSQAQTPLKGMLALCLPFGCMIALLLTYNYLRFDSFFEFGQRYQLGDFRVLNKYFSPEYFLHNFRAYMVSASRIDSHFPFFHLRTLQAPINSVVYGEPVGGALATAPLTGLAFLLIPIWIFQTSGRVQLDRSKPLAILATLLGLNGFIMVSFLSFFGGLTERYVLEFIPSFLFSAILVWIILYQSLTARPLHRRALNLFLVLLLTFQVSLNLAVSLTGYYDNLLEYNPVAYQQIRSWFSFIEPR